MLGPFQIFCLKKLHNLHNKCYIDCKISETMNKPQATSVRLGLGMSTRPVPPNSPCPGRLPGFRIKLPSKRYRGRTRLAWPGLGLTCCLRHPRAAFPTCPCPGHLLGADQCARRVSWGIWPLLSRFSKQWKLPRGRKWDCTVLPGWKLGKLRLP